MLLSQDDVENLNRTYGIGLQVGYLLKEAQYLKIGVALNQSFYDYRIVKRNVTSPSGQLADVEEYQEKINISNASFGVIYSIEIENNFFLDFEVLSFSIKNEDRRRTGFKIHQKEGLIERGISYATDQNYFGFKTRIYYSINPHFKIGVNLLISNERINLPDIINDSKFNLFLGTSIAYKI